MKKAVKDILIAIGVILILAIGLLFGISPSYKMGFMTDYLFKNISQYKWEAILGTDPVKTALTEALGEDKPESAEAIYNILESKAKNMTWEMLSADGKESYAEVKVEFDNGNPVLDTYADMLTEYVCTELEAGRISLGDVPKLMEIIPDEKNAELLKKAGETELTERLETTATVSFDRHLASIYIPNNISDEIYDAVTCGIYGGISELPGKVIELLIPRLLDTFFKDLCAFDVKAMENITGYDIGKLLTIENYPVLSEAAINYIAQRAGDIKYSVGRYDSENGKISVECSYSDGSSIVENFTASILYYAVTHLFDNPIPDDAALAELFTASAEAISDFPRISSTLIFSIDPNAGTFEIPEAIADVASANIVSKFNSMAEIFDREKLIENAKQQIKDKFPAKEIKEYAQQAIEDAGSIINSETASEFVADAREAITELFQSEKIQDIFSAENAANIMQNIFSMINK